MRLKTDAELQQDVMDELAWRIPLKEAEVAVRVKDGVVTLYGVTDSYSKKRAAEKAAEKVKGVKAIVESIEVKLPGSSERTDEDIAKAAYNAIKWHAGVPDEQIKIVVKEGWITLEGQVDWNYQKTAAEYAVEDLMGVHGVVNTIEVKPQVKVEDINRRIESAFARQASIDARNIHVDVEGGKVILKGKVRSYVEKKDAEKAAWVAPGVTTIDDRLEIEYR